MSRARGSRSPSERAWRDDAILLAALYAHLLGDLDVVDGQLTLGVRALDHEPDLVVVGRLDPLPELLRRQCLLLEVIGFLIDASCPRIVSTRRGYPFEVGGLAAECGR